jgi:hypothetical protein
MTTQKARQEALKEMQWLDNEDSIRAWTIKYWDILEAALQPQIPEWQPIETAPKPRKSDKDVERILLWDGITQKTGYWCDTSYQEEEFIRETKSGKRIYEWVDHVSGYWEVDGDFLSPTHWKHLDKPPISSAPKEGK